MYPKEYEDKLISFIREPDNLAQILISGVTSDTFNIRRDVFDFIIKYKNKYSNVPSKSVIEANFQDFKVVDNVKPEETKFYIDELKKFEIKRKARKILDKSVDMMESDPYGCLDYLIAKLPALRKTSDYTRSYTDREAESRYEDYINRSTLNAQGLTVGIRTGFSILDDKLMGWQRGNLITIVASSGKGKTWLAQYLAAFPYVMEEQRVLFLEPEMSISESELRWDTIVGKLMGYKFSNKGLSVGTGVNKHEYKEFLDKVSKNERWLTLTSDNRKRFTIQSIEAEVEKFSPDIVVLDGFLLLDIGVKDWTTMEDAAAGIKNIAQNYNLIFIVTAQASRSAKDEMPEIHEVFGGEALRHQSDCMIMMSDTDEPKVRKIVIPKRRNGEPINKPIKISFDVDIGAIGI
jgi:replicative DNA helicase